MKLQFRSAVVFGCVVIGTIVFSKPAFSMSVPASNKHYFDFSLQSYSVREAQDTEVTFLWNISGFTMPGQKRLTVVPSSSNGRVVIYNPTLNSYVGSSDLATTHPYLEEHMVIQVLGIKGASMPYSLKFIIRDTYTGVIYETAEKKIWDFSFYERYTELINKNLLETTASVAEQNSPPPMSEPTDGTEYKNPVKISLWYLSPLFFFAGLLKLHSDPG